MATKPSLQQFSATQVAATWCRHAADLQQRALYLIWQERELTEPVLEFFNFLKNDPRVFHFVMDKIHEQHLMLGLDILTETGMPYAVQGADYHVTTINKRYTLRYNCNGDADKCITNFAIHFNAGWDFKELKQIWYSGTLYLERHEYPIRIQADDLRRVDLLLAACRRAIYDNRHGLPLAQPILIRPAYRQDLLRLLQCQIAGITANPGISRLGWNRDKKWFSAPAWRFANNQLTYRQLIVPPVNSLFSEYYNFDPMPPCPPANTAAWYINACVAVLVAALRRTYHNWPIPELRVHHNASSEYLLRAVFRALGQTAALTPACKQLDRSLSGYPVYSIGTPLTTTSPVFILAASGVAIPDASVAADHMPGISALVVDVLARCIPFIINETPAIMTQQCASFFDLAKEGKAVMDLCYGVINVGHADCNTLWQYFSTIPPDNTHAYVAIDVKEQTVYFNFHKTGVRRKTVKEELMQMRPGANVAMYGTRHIRINAVDALELIRAYFGRDIKITNFVKPESSEAVSDSEEACFSHTNI